MEYSLPHLKFAPTPQWLWWTSLSKSNHGGVSEETSQAWQPTLRGKFPSMLAFHPFKKSPPNAWVSPLQKNAPIKFNTSDWEIHFCTFLFILDEFFLKLKLPKSPPFFSNIFFGWFSTSTAMIFQKVWTWTSGRVWRPPSRRAMINHLPDELGSG